MDTGKVNMFAKKAHDIWAHWMKYQFSKCFEHKIANVNFPLNIFNEVGTGGLVISKDLAERWSRQMNTPYEELSEQEQKSDIEIAEMFKLDSDGYHTFDELYEFRKVYNAALFNEWAKPFGITENGITTHDVHKSWKHHDGEPCFGGGWFIVVAILPTGQISNHYEAKDWDLFKIPETETAKYPFDGHTPNDVLERLKNL